MTMSPCFHRMMPVGIVSPAAKTVAESGRPSESVVGELLDRAAGGFGVERIARVFDDVDSAKLVELHGNRVTNVGLGGEELDTEALLDLEGFERLFGRVGRRRGLAGAEAGGQQRDDQLRNAINGGFRLPRLPRAEWLCCPESVHRLYRVSTCRTGGGSAGVAVECRELGRGLRAALHCGFRGQAAFCV